MRTPWNILWSHLSRWRGVPFGSPGGRKVWKSRPVTPLNKKIIVLDDEATVRDVLALELNKRGYTAIPMESKAEGYFWIVDNQPDLIISDIKSPRMDGFELLKMLKSHPFTCDIPFIFITAYSDFEYIDTAKKLGASEFILKPYNIRKLTKTIERILRDSQKEPASKKII
jgi:two-component system phosphate regulon response regulator PhoB